MTVTVVKKEDYIGSNAPEFGTPQRVEFHLKNWQSWMRSGQEVDGFPSTTPGTVNWSIKSDVDGMINRFERQNAEIVDMIIHQDLAPAERAAIHHRFLHAVYAFPRDNLRSLLASAKLKIGASLRQRCIY